MTKLREHKVSSDDPFLVGPWRRLINTAAGQKGGIHDDDAAQQLGFRGGFVPGSVVGTAAMPAVVAAFGSKWMEGGWYSFTFASPIYVDDEVHEVATWSGADIVVQVVDRAGRVCCSGRAGTGSTVPWDVAADGSHDPGSVFPGIEIGYTYAPRQFTPERDICLGTVDASGDQTPWYRDRSPWGGPVVPPEYLHVAALQLVRQAADADTLPVAGVRGPGMWAAHDLVVHAPLPVDGSYMMTEKIVDKGRSGRALFLTYEFEVFAQDSLVAHGRHKAKWLSEASV